MDCYSAVASPRSASPFLRGAATTPSIEVYLAGCCSGFPLILTKTIPLASRKKVVRQGALESIPEDEETGAQQTGSIALLRRTALQILEDTGFGPLCCYGWSRNEKASILFLPALLMVLQQSGVNTLNAECMSYLRTERKEGVHSETSPRKSVTKYITINGLNKTGSTVKLCICKYIHKDTLSTYTKLGTQPYVHRWKREKQVTDERMDPYDPEDKISHSFYTGDVYSEDDGELTWFNAGVRVGVGIGLGMCLGIGIGVGLLMGSYQATTRSFKRKFF